MGDDPAHPLALGGVPAALRPGRRAALRTLLGFGAELRSRGFAASMADTIEAYRLACTLAELRDKAQFTLNRLHLVDDERVIRQRRAWYERE